MTDNMGQWILWLSISIIGGGLLAYFSLIGFGKLLKLTNTWKTSSDCGNDSDMVPTWFSGIIVGIAERLFFTVTIGLGGLGTGALTAMLIWTTIKAQTLYNIFPGGESPTISRRAAYNALVAGLVSLLVSVICGTIIYNLSQSEL